MDVLNRLLPIVLSLGAVALIAAIVAYRLWREAMRASD